MKMMVNTDFGGFGISNDVLDKYDISDELLDDELRIHPVLIAALERDEDIAASYAQLEVIDIPNNATDWMIQEYDGLETVYYVLNGKIHCMD